MPKKISDFISRVLFPSPRTPDVELDELPQFRFSSENLQELSKVAGPDCLPKRKPPLVSSDVSDRGTTYLANSESPTPEVGKAHGKKEHKRSDDIEAQRDTADVETKNTTTQVDLSHHPRKHRKHNHKRKKYVDDNPIAKLSPFNVRDSKEDVTAAIRALNDTPKRRDSLRLPKLGSSKPITTRSLDDSGPSPDAAESSTSKAKKAETQPQKRSPLSESTHSHKSEELVNNIDDSKPYNTSETTSVVPCEDIKVQANVIATQESTETSTTQKDAAPAEEEALPVTIAELPVPREPLASTKGLSKQLSEQSEENRVKTDEPRFANESTDSAPE